MSQFFPPNTAAQLWVQQLASAYRNGIRLSDPSIASLRDPESFETMLNEPCIRQAFDRRATLTAGLSWNIEAEGDGDAAKQAAKLSEKMLRSIRQFRESRKHLAKSAVTRGTGFVHLEWERRWMPLGDGRMREWRVPSMLKPIDRREFRAVPSTDFRSQPQVVHVEWERWDVARSSWTRIDPREKPNYVRHAYDDGPERLGYGHGLMDAVYFFWYFLTAIREEHLQGIEFWSRGFIEVLVKNAREGTKINQTLVDNYQTQIEHHRSRHSFVHDAEDEVKLTTGGGEGSSICVEAIKELKAEIRALVNHSSDNVVSNENGSYARADAQSDSEQMIVEADRESLSETLTVGVLERAWRLNLGNVAELGLAGESPGKFAIVNQKVADPEKTVGVFDKALRAGIPIPKKFAYDELGIPMPKPNEEVIQPISQAATDPFAALAGLGGGPRPVPQIPEGD